MGPRRESGAGRAFTGRAGRLSSPGRALTPALGRDADQSAAAPAEVDPRASSNSGWDQTMDAGRPGGWRPPLRAGCGRFWTRPDARHRRGGPGDLGRHSRDRRGAQNGTASSVPAAGVAAGLAGGPCRGQDWTAPPDTMIFRTECALADAPIHVAGGIPHDRPLLIAMRAARDRRRYPAGDPRGHQFPGARAFPGNGGRGVRTSRRAEPRAVRDERTICAERREDHWTTGAHDANRVFALVALPPREQEKPGRHHLP